MNIDSNTPDSWDCQNSTYLYPPAGHGITSNLNVILGAWFLKAQNIDIDYLWYWFQ